MHQENAKENKDVALLLPDKLDFKARSLQKKIFLKIVRFKKIQSIRKYSN